MGIYSEKLIEEAKKSKIDTSKNDFSEVDNQIETMIIKLRDEYGIEPQGIRNAILHKMESNIESFIDKNGNIIITGVTNTLEAITKAAVNENKESIDVENSKVEKEQLNTIEQMSKDEESFAAMWRKNGEAILDIFENMDDERRKINPKVLGAEGIEDFIEHIWNVNLKDEEAIRKGLIDYTKSKQITEEEKKQILDMLKEGKKPSEVRKQYFLQNPEKMRRVIGMQVAKEGFNEYIEKMGFSVEEIKRACLNGQRKYEHLISMAEAIEFNKVKGSIEIFDRDLAKLANIKTEDELRAYCEAKKQSYDEYAKLLEETIDDPEKRTEAIKNIIVRSVEEQREKQEYKNMVFESMYSERVKIYLKTPFFKELSKIKSQKDLNELSKKYGLEGLNLSLENVGESENQIKILESLDKNLRTQRSEFENTATDITAGSTAEEFGKVINQNFIVLGQDNIAIQKDYESYDIYKRMYEQSKLNSQQQMPDANYYPPATASKEEVQEKMRADMIAMTGLDNYSATSRKKIIFKKIEVEDKSFKNLKTFNENLEKINKEEMEKEAEGEFKNKNDERKLDERVSFEALRAFGYHMKTTRNSKDSLRDIIDRINKNGFEEFKRVYLEKVLGIEAKISDEDFEKMFMLKETLREKDRMYEQLLECTTEKEFNEMVEQLEIDMLDLKFGQDPSEIYTDEDLEKMVEIVKIMRNIETREISKPEEEEITEDTVVDIEKVEEKAEEPKTDEKPNLNIMITNPEYIAEKGKQIMQTICDDRINGMSHTQAKEKKGMPNKLEIREKKLPYFEKTVNTKWEKPTSIEMIWAVDKNRNILKTEGLPYKVEKNDGTIRAINELTSKANSTTVQTKKSEGYDKHALNIEEKTWNVKTTLGQSLKVQEEYSLDDFSDFTAMIDEFEMELEQPTEQPVVAVVDKKITGPASLAKAMAKPKEMVLDYMEMNIGSGTDPKNATLVMADMLRDNKLLTKFKGASEQGITLEEYSDIMSGVVVETEAMIVDGKLPAVISENNQERETTIDDFINMTFDDTEILLSNLPERPQGLDKEEVRELIESQVLEAQRLQEQHTEENLGEGEKTQQELAELLKAQQREKEVEQAAVTVEKEVEAKEAKITDVTEAVNQEVVQEEKVVIAKEEEPAVEEIVQEEPKVEQALTVIEEKSLAQKVGGRLSEFFQSAKEKVSKFVENIKEKLSGSNSDKNFGSEVFAMDATKGKKNKSIDDQWGTVNVDIKAAREYAKEIQEAKQAAGNEKETVSVSERNDD